MNEGISTALQAYGLEGADGEGTNADILTDIDELSMVREIKECVIPSRVIPCSSLLSPIRSCNSVPCVICIDSAPDCLT